MTNLIKLLIILSLFVNSTIFGEKYYNNEYFKFILPEKIDIINGTILNDFENKFIIFIDIRTPDNLLGGIEKFRKINDEFNKNVPPDIPNIPANFIKYEKIDNKKISIDFLFGFDPSDNYICKRICFIKSNKLISITISYFFSQKDKDFYMNVLDIIDNYQKRIYKRFAKDNNEMSKVMIEIEKDIKDKQKQNIFPKEMIMLYKNFDLIFNSLEIK